MPILLPISGGSAPFLLDTQLLVIITYGSWRHFDVFVQHIGLNI